MTQKKKTTQEKPDTHPLAFMLEEDYPLLRHFSEVAPGTYKHSEEVGALCKKIGNALELDGTFMQIAGMYHDVGKIFWPINYFENQLLLGEKKNIHDTIDNPLYSFQLISRHVGDTVSILANEPKIPPEQLIRLLQVVSQHHGTTYGGYFLKQAQENSKFKETDEILYRYSGPIPSSPEAAILMITDEAEAASRSVFARLGAEDPAPNVKQLIQDIMNTLDEMEQLDAMNYKHGRIAKTTLVSEIEAKYHDRISY